MTSSESGEDFESADEDFDIDNPSKHKSDKKSADTGEEKVVVKEENSPEDVSVDFVQQLDDLKLDTETKVKPDIDCSVKTNDVAHDSIEEVKVEEIKPKPTTKKLGTKLNTNLKTDDIPVPITEKRQENIPEREKGVSDVNEPNLSEERVDDNVTKPVESLVTNFKESVNEIPQPSEKPDKQIPQPSEEPVVVESHPGDGWEIEEEDGFDVTTTLEKSIDGSAQSVQEPISEIDRLEYRPSRDKQAQGWGGWGGWGVGSILSTATDSVTTFSSQVTAGLSTVLETAVGAPDPETLASATASQERQDTTTRVEDKTAAGYVGLGSIVSGVSFLGSSVINRGLDTLETLGKKTMEVLQEGDPGLKKKRAMLFSDQDKPVLSQILREAKEKADNSDKEREEKETARKAHFESLFDDFQGMVHLEALEMLSTQCELKLQSLLLSKTGDELLDLQETLSQVQDLCELPDDDDDTPALTPAQFAEQVTKCVNGLAVKISPAKIIQVNKEIIDRLSRLDTETATVVNQSAISSLAEFTAAAMECFHKSAELLLAKSTRSTPSEADNYVELTSHLCARVSVISSEFTQLLTKNQPIANSSIITNIFLEASNSCSYMKNACQLLVPILQVGAVPS